MKAVACQVREQTKGNHRTWEHSCLRETVTLMPGESQAAAMAREMSRARTAQFAAQQAQLMKLQQELHVLSQESEPKPEAAEYAVVQVQQPKMMERDTYRASNKITAPQKSRNHAYKTRPYFLWQSN